MIEENENEKNLGEDNFEDLLNLLEGFDEEDSENYDEFMKALGLDFDDLDNEALRESFLLDLSFSKSHPDAYDPMYMYSTDSGFDLFSTEEVWIHSLDRKLIPTGLHFDIPEGYEIQVRSKSGLALNQGLMVLNSPGTIDQGYTGEIQVIVFNTSKEKVKINKGQKIAQAVVSPVVSGKWIKLIQKETIKEKDRNNNGFGSTGI
jgi:dUTP pyrophosphatase